MSWRNIIKEKSASNHIMMLKSLKKDMETMKKRFSNVLGEQGLNLLNEILQLCDRKIEQIEYSQKKWPKYSPETERLWDKLVEQKRKERGE